MLLSRFCRLIALVSYSGTLLVAVVCFLYTMLIDPIRLSNEDDKSEQDKKTFHLKDLRLCTSCNNPKHMHRSSGRVLRMMSRDRGWQGKNEIWRRNLCGSTSP